MYRKQIPPPLCPPPYNNSFSAERLTSGKTRKDFHQNSLQGENSNGELEQTSHQVQTDREERKKECQPELGQLVKYKRGGGANYTFLTEYSVQTCTQKDLRMIKKKFSGQLYSIEHCVAWYNYGIGRELERMKNG